MLEVVGTELVDALAALRVAVEVVPPVRAVLRIAPAEYTGTVLVIHTEADDTVAGVALGADQDVVEEGVVDETVV